MVDNKMIESIVREVLKNMGEKPLTTKTRTTTTTTTTQSTRTAGLSPDRDYPLATKRPELLKTPTGKTLKDVTLESILNGSVKSEDVRITPETLRLQAEIAEGVGRSQFANNLRRAAELVTIPDDRLLEIYNALRPYRSTKQELLEIAEELEVKFDAKINAAFVREAAGVYERRKRLRAE